MPRKPRIQYAGADYHVMNRGDRRRRVFRDRVDYELFMRAMDEACERTGWRIHAYVLMPTHFHWLLETPEPNLVDGMKWFMGATSQRSNARHGEHGHVFQGRYKALVVQSDQGGYFDTVSTYIHLNPVRANLSGGNGGMGEYEWSSYGLYVKPKRVRPQWLEVDRVLGNLALTDRPAGRRAYAQYMEDRANEWRTKEGKKAFKEAWKPIRYGWFLGEEDFKETLLTHLGPAVAGKQRTSYGGAAIQAHDEAQAEKLVGRGMKALGLEAADLATLPKGDAYKCVLAWLAHRHTMVSHSWLCERLIMGSPSNMSTYISRAKSTRMRALRGKVEKGIRK